MTDRRVLFACDLDSQVFGALPFALAFRARGWRVTFAIDAGLALPTAVAERLAGRFEIVERPLCALAASREVFDHDAIGVFTTGSRIAQFRNALELARRVFELPRPALFCGFNGLVYEKFEEGVAWRLGVDQLCLSGPRDQAAFEAFCAGTPFGSQPISLVGLRRKTDQPIRPRKAQGASGARKLFLFAEQVAAPNDLGERIALVRSLSRLAAGSPGWDVVVKARVRPDERTFHEQVGHVATLIEAIPDRPTNFVVSYDPIDELLERAELFGTVSSTALFDALDLGVPCIVASDFGVRNAYGSHVFVRSGLMTALRDLASLDHAPRVEPDPAWLADIGYGASPSPDALIDSLERSDRAAPLPPPFYSFETTTRSAATWVRHADAVLAARAALDQALGRGDQDTSVSALAHLRDALATSDRQRAVDAAWKLREGRSAALARRLGVYWAYKKVRTRLLGEVPR